MLLPLLLALFLLPLTAQENRYEGQNVNSVGLQPEDSWLDPADLAEKLAAIKTGQPLRMADVRNVVERLYATGRFTDIEVDATAEGAGVAIRFQISPASFVRNVDVRGVPEPPSRGLLNNITDLQLGQQFTRSALRQSTERLMDILRTNGFYLAKVTPEQTAQPFQQVDVNFNVDSGKRAKYDQPIVKGTPNKSVNELVRISRWRKYRGFGPFKQVTDIATQQGLDRIRRAYQKKDFLMARVSLDLVEYRPSDNRVIPTITVESGPLVSVRTKGAKVSKSLLRELVPVYQEQTVDKDLLVEGKRELTEHFQARGFFEATVDFDQSLEKDRQVILYSIFPGSRHKLVSVEVTGNKYFTTDTLRERMYTTEASFLRFRRGRFSQDYLRRDINAIKSLYQQNGFRDIAVTTETIDDYNGKEDDVAAIFRVNEGPQWFVNSLKLEGIEAAAEGELMPLLQAIEGQPYSETNVATDADTILSYFYNIGFPDARLDPVATPVEGRNQIDVKFTVQPGTRQFVRDVLISGLSATRSEMVTSRIRDLAPGSPLAQRSMIESQRRLYDLGIFARVDTALQNSEGDTDRKYVLYRLEEASRWSVNGGIGAQIARIGRVSTNLDTPAGSAGFSPRISFGVSRNNFLGVGHTITLQTQWAPGVRQRGILTYLAPQFKGIDNLSLTVTGLIDDSRDVSTFSSKRREASVQLAQRLTKANTIQYRVAYRQVTVGDIAITPALIPLFAMPVQLGTISSTFIQDRRDDPVDAHRGIWNTIDGTFASNFFGQPRTTFTRVLGRNATYHRIGKDMILARQLSLGLQAQHSSSEVPLPERFFAGGTASHRGFPENQAGPRDVLTGFPLGGKSLLVHNTELRFPFLGDNIGGVIFHDAGNVYRSISDISFRFNQRDIEDFNYMVHAIGFGIRYRTPVGPVRVDLAYGLNSPRFNGLKGTREQLLNPDAFGPNCANLAIGCVQFLEQRISRFQFHFSLGQLF
ncbi:MAG: BamA/TamA family outer membrane protein [Bryobacteraceae bacterium]|nr:BamA/TamA family outer membrane protein [Bryobacteraceae bacterium]